MGRCSCADGDTSALISFVRRGLRWLDRPSPAGQGAEVFDGWIAAGTDRFVAEGLDLGEARRLVTSMICALEGAFVLCRALRSTEPMEHAGSLVIEAVRASLASRQDPLR
jgi:hypothetical protein